MSNVIPFRPRAKQSPPRRAHEVPDVLLFTVWNKTTGVQTLAVDATGAASKLGLSLAEFEAQQPVPKVEGTDEPFYSVDDVARVMYERGIPVGTIEKARR